MKDVLFIHFKFLNHISGGVSALVQEVNGSTNVIASTEEDLDAFADENEKRVI